MVAGPAANLLSVGRETVDAGLSTVLVSQGGWRLSTSLRIREARDSADDAVLQGLPDVRATLLQHSLDDARIIAEAALSANDAAGARTATRNPPRP